MKQRAERVGSLLKSKCNNAEAGLQNPKRGKTNVHLTLGILSHFVGLWLSAVALEHMRSRRWE